MIDFDPARQRIDSHARYGESAIALAEQISTPAAISQPDPSHYRAASRLLSVYFWNVVPDATPDTGMQLYHVADATAEALLTLYHRDSLTHRHTVGRRVGEHPADPSLGQALRLTYEAQTTIPHRQTQHEWQYALGSTARALDAYQQAETTKVPPQNDEGVLTLRSHAARAVTNVRGFLHEPSLGQALAEIGRYAANAVFELAPSVSVHPNDTHTVTRLNPQTGQPESVPMHVMYYRDAIAQDVSRALSAAYDPRWTDQTHQAAAGVPFSGTFY